MVCLAFVCFYLYRMGRKALEFNPVEGIEYMIPYVRGCDGCVEAIMDPKIYEEVRGNEQIQQQLHDFLNPALLCS